MFIRNTVQTNNFRIISYQTRLFACFRRFLLKNDLFYNQLKHFLTFLNSLHKVMLGRQLKNPPYIFFNEPTNRQHRTDNLLSCYVLFRLCFISAYICFNIFLSLKTNFTAGSWNVDTTKISLIFFFKMKNSDVGRTRAPVVSRSLYSR